MGSNKVEGVGGGGGGWGGGSGREVREEEENIKIIELKAREMGQRPNKTALHSHSN